MKFSKWITGLCLLAGLGTAQADSFPTRPVRIVVIVSPGGSADAVARMMAEGLTQRLGQPVVVDNKPGAGGNVASQLVAKSAPDGHTLLLTANNHAINPALFAQAGYTIDDFTAVAQLMEGPSVIAVGAQSRFNSLADLLQEARQKPNTVAYGSAGIGLPSHMAGEMLARSARMQWTHIAYKGSGPSITDAIGGQLPVVIGSLVAGMPHIDSGKLKPLAVTSLKRWPSAPQIPAAAEFGLPDYEHMTWLGLFAPKGTPASVVSRLNSEIGALLAQDAIKERIAKLGGVATPKDAATFDAQIRKEHATSSRLIAEAGLKAE